MAPVSERSLNAPRSANASRSLASVNSAAKPAPAGYYRVRSGDTLYSIAWRFRKDYRALARVNNIDRSYRIYSGQLIRLARAPAAKGSAKASIAAPKTSPSRPIQRVPSKAPIASTPLKWRWPASGRVVGGFRAKGKLNKGLNIAGMLGDPVLSAAAGKVVYAGNGLLGYGNLIIVNHNDSFLSAYAHNRKLLVKEQDLVRLGQKIAEIGNSGSDQTMLHFEIRKEGKPVDPRRYLPRR